MPNNQVVFLINFPSFLSFKMTALIMLVNLFVVLKNKKNKKFSLHKQTVYLNHKILIYQNAEYCTPKFTPCPLSTAGAAWHAFTFDLFLHFIMA